jgi:hypothetical protein
MIVSLMIPQAKVVELPEEVGNAGDVTDYFVRLKHSREDFLQLLNEAKSFHPPTQPVSKTPSKQTYNSSLINSSVKNQAEQIKKVISIADVIGQYLPLRSSSTKFVGCCPFHDDKVPSFTVYPETQTFYCFGCRAYGDVITFIQKVERMTFTQALEILKHLSHESGPSQEKPKRKAA